MGALTTARRLSRAAAPGALLAMALAMALAMTLAACSPEARRVRDGGPGADPGNTDLVPWQGPDPHAADTTLWPRRAPAPVERFARGEIPPPTYPHPAARPPKVAERPVRPDVPPSEAQQRTFDRSRTADPRRRSDSARLDSAPPR